MRPNIFNYATSELSQDAFLLWLGKWADNKCSEDQELNMVAKNYILDLILRQYPDYDAEIVTVKVDKQWKRVDVRYTINNEILIIIEDKTNTGTHSGQLGRYQAIAKKWCNENNYYEPICVYYKSEDEDLLTLRKIENAGYHILTRFHLLETLKVYSGENDIIIDYRSLLEKIESESLYYMSNHYAKWNDRAWKGFYIYLQKEFPDGNWGYVANPSGGFWGYWWNFIKIDDYKLYLQIEQGKLCIKISDISSDYNTVRNRVYSIVMETAKILGDNFIKKPSRFGSGRCMTIAEIAPELYMSEDINETKKVLRRYMDFIRTVANKLTE